MTVGTRGQGRGYTLANYQDGGVFKRVVRFTCVDCGATHDINKVTDTVNPEALAKQVRRLGWEADAWREQDCRCPMHTKAGRRAANDTDSELKKLEAKMEVVGAPIVAIMKEPTQEQRREIRKLLEEHFDEVAGCYQERWSDETIASRVGIPMVVVQRIRDTSYGPIRVTPEMLQLRKEAAELKAEVDAIGAEIERLMDRQAALTKRVAEIDAKAQRKAA